MRSPKARLAALVALIVAATALWWGLRDASPGAEPAVKTAALGTKTWPARGKLDGSGARLPAASHALPWAGPGAVISGMVRTADGTGLPGAQVCAWSHHDRAPTSVTREPRCTKSDSSGHYRVEDMPPVNASVHASKEGYIPSRFQTDDKRAQIQLSAGQERTHVDLELAPGGVAVSGVVSDLAGGVVEGAWVSATSETEGAKWSSRPRSVAQTDADGKFTLWTAEGRVHVTASSEGYTDASRSGVAPGYTFELFLTPESTISGKVVRADTKEPVANASVSASNSNFGWGGISTTTEEDGTFRIDRLQPGKYHPTAVADGLYGKSTQSVNVGLAESAEGLVIEVHPLASLHGTVVIAGTQGEPCTHEGTVSLTGKSGNSQTYWGRAEPDGSVNVRAIKPGTYTLAVGCDKLVRRTDFEDLTFDTASVRDQVWELSPGIQLAGTVVDPEGNPIAHADVSANTTRQARGSGPSQWKSAQTEKNGTFVIEGLTAGTYKLNANAKGFLAQSEPAELEVGESGADPQTLTLEPGGEITGTVSDAGGESVAGATVRVSNSGWGASSTTGDDGSYHLRGAKPGTHRVSASRGWRNKMRAPGATDDEKIGTPVTVVAGEVAVADLVVESHGGTISGHVVDGGGGPVADAFIDHTRESDSAAAAAGRSRQSVRWGSWDKQAILTDEGGNFTLEGLADGKYTIRAYRKGGGEATVEHVETGSTGVQVAISETGTVAGMVVFDSGGSPDDFKVVLNDKAQGLWASDSFYKTDGAFTFSELAPGEYEVVVTSDAGDAKSTATLEAGSDVIDLKLELSPRVTVVGRLLDLETKEPVPGMRVVVSPRKGGGFRFGADTGDEPNITDEDGKFTVEKAATGRVRIMALPRDFSDEAYGWTTMNGTVPPDATTHDLGDLFAVPSRRQRTDDEGDLGLKLKQRPPEDESDNFPLTVAFVRPGGPAADAGLAVGDVVISVDGHDVTGTNRYRYKGLANVVPGTSVKLGMEGGDDVTIVATKKDD